MEVINQTKDFFTALSTYYSEFLSTDFKKSRLPKRQIIKVDNKGNLVGISLSKYPSFKRKLYGKIYKPINEGIEIKIKRGQYKSNLPRSVKDAITYEIKNIDVEKIKEVIDITIVKLEGLYNKKIDIELEYQSYIEHIRERMISNCIKPLVDRLEKYFENCGWRLWNVMFLPLES